MEKNAETMPADSYFIEEQLDELREKGKLSKQAASVVFEALNTLNDTSKIPADQRPGCFSLLGEILLKLPFSRKILPDQLIPDNVRTKPERKRLRRTLDKIDESEIGSLSFEDFTRAAHGTKDPRKLVLGQNAIDQAEEALQQQIKQYLKENHNIDPKGRVRLNVIVSEYESASNGKKYYGSVQASFNGKTRILYRLNEEELAEELRHRQISQTAASLTPIS